MDYANWKGPMPEVTFALLSRARGVKFVENPRGLWTLAGEPTLVLKPAGDIDFPVLCRIHRQAMEASVVQSVGQWDGDVQLSRLKRHFDPSTLWAVTISRVTRGFIRLIAEDGLLVEQFYLEPQFQKQGLGRRILAAVLAVADEAKVAVRLDVLKGSRARGLYERVGFVKHGEDTYQDHLVRAPVA